MMGKKPSSTKASREPGRAPHGCLCFLQPKGFMADVELSVLTTLMIDGFPL